MADGDPEGKSPRSTFLSKFRSLKGKLTTEKNNPQKQNENKKQDPKQSRRAISPNDGVWPTQDDGENSQSTNDENAGKTNKTNVTTKNYAPWGGIRHPTLETNDGLQKKVSFLKQKEIKKERISSIPNLNENNDGDVNESNDDFFLDDELFEINAHTAGQRHRTPNAVNTHSNPRMSVSMVISTRNSPVFRWEETSTDAAKCAVEAVEEEEEEVASAA